MDEEPEHGETARAESRIFGNVHTDFTKNATFYRNHHWVFTPGLEQPWPLLSSLQPLAPS